MQQRRVVRRCVARIGEAVGRAAPSAWRRSSVPGSALARRPRRPAARAAASGSRARMRRHLAPVQRLGGHQHLAPPSSMRVAIGSGPKAENSGVTTRAVLERAEHRDVELGDAPGQHEHAVARADAQRRQHVGEAVGRGAQLGIAQVRARAPSAPRKRSAVCVRQRPARHGGRPPRGRCSALSPPPGASSSRTCCQEKPAQAALVGHVRPHRRFADAVGTRVHDGCFSVHKRRRPAPSISRVTSVTPPSLTVKRARSSSGCTPTRKPSGSTQCSPTMARRNTTPAADHHLGQQQRVLDDAAVLHAHLGEQQRAPHRGAADDAAAGHQRVDGLAAPAVVVEHELRRRQRRCSLRIGQAVVVQVQLGQRRARSMLAAQ